MKEKTPNINPPKKINLATAIRDAVDAKKNQQSWDDLNEISESTGEYILVQAMAVNDILSGREARIRELDTLNELAILTTGISRDIDIITSEFELIRAKHETRKGPIKGSNELFEAISIHEEYIALNSKIASIILPTFHEITQKVQYLFKEENKDE